MLTTFSRKLNKQLNVIYPGEYFASNEDCVIGTVTGNCLVICFYEIQKNISGMGHFIIPGSMSTKGLLVDEIASHGIANIEYIMGEIVKLGGDRKHVRAKLFGAADFDGNNKIKSIVFSNISFIHEYFNMEKIPVDIEDLGGNSRRKIYLYAKNGKAYRKFLTQNGEASEFIKMEAEYIDQAFKKKETFGKVILFD